MVIFGITGGSGTGKTTVSKMLADCGVHIIDTDVIARRVVAVGSECLKELVAHFGDVILNKDGSLDRKCLASIAFSDEKNTRALNNITHKYIKLEVLDNINNTRCDFIGIDGAVIIGSNIEPICEFVVSVLADRDVRIERIKARDGISDVQALQRINAQKNDKFYIENSKYIIYNNGDILQLQNSVAEFFDKIKGYGFE